MTAGKWTVSQCEENWPGGLPEWETAAEAILHGPEALGLEPGDAYYVGRQRAPRICVPDADNILDHVLCQDDFSLDCAEDAFRCTREQTAELTAAVERVFLEWMHKHGLQPRHFLIDESTMHVFDAESVHS